MATENVDELQPVEPVQPVFTDYYSGTVNPGVKIDESAFIGDQITEDYTPSAFPLGVGLMNRNRPIFSYYMVRDMLADPRILLGLWLLKGPIVARTSFEVVCNDSTVSDYITTNVSRFYRVAAHRVLKAIEWGYSASEVEYRFNNEDGLIHFHDVKDLESLDCRPYVYKGKVVGFHYRQKSDPWASVEKTKSISRKESGWDYVGCPRALWHVHSPERNRYFGISRLYGVHVPWWEKWSEDGFRQIRRLWFTKCAFDGGTLYHPPGTINTNRGPMPARDYARQLLEQKRAGAVLTFPNTAAGTDGTSRAWEYIPPEAMSTPAGLLEYGDSLDAEILEAFGIPPEVIQSSGETGFGSSSGRGVPQDAFHASLHELNLELIKTFDTQSLRYLVLSQFGSNVEYEIIVHPIGSEPTPEPVDEEGLPMDTEEEGDPSEAPEGEQPAPVE